MFCKIKVSYLVAYDYNLTLVSIKQLYQFVDKIVLAIDADNLTWSGNKFKIPGSFFEDIRNFDTENKIEIYFDKFYNPELSPMDCESRQRNLALKRLGKGWKVQLDVDEYVYDFSRVCGYLKKYWFFTIFPNLTPMVFKGELVTLFKKLENGYIYIDNHEQFPFITNQNYNTHTRRNDKVKNFSAGIKVIHQSWARSEEEIKFKILNWGHRDDFNTNDYFKFWQSLSESNYSNVKNFHPIVPSVWESMKFLAGSNINQFITSYAATNPQKLKYNSGIKLLKYFIKRLFSDR